MVADALQTIERRASKVGPRGLSTGLEKLDRMLGGLAPGQLIIVGSRPEFAKTALVMQIAETIAVESGIGVLVFSLEMGRASLVEWLLCRRAGIDLAKARHGLIRGEDDWLRLVRAASVLEAAPLFISDVAHCPARAIYDEACAAADHQRIGLVVVDTIQLVRSGRLPRRGVERLLRVCWGLKKLAEDLQVPLLATAMLYPELPHRYVTRPRLSDLRGCGSVQQCADVVLLAFRDEFNRPSMADRGIAELIVARHRNGPTGTVRVRFVHKTAQFADLAESEDL